MMLTIMSVSELSILTTPVQVPCGCGMHSRAPYCCVWLRETTARNLCDVGLRAILSQAIGDITSFYYAFSILEYAFSILEYALSKQPINGEFPHTCCVPNFDNM